MSDVSLDQLNYSSLLSGSEVYGLLKDMWRV